MARHGKNRRTGPWWGNDHEQIRFEQGTCQIASLRARNVRGRGRRYTLSIDVPEYGRRRVVIWFRTGSARLPRVSVDGPTKSKHRNYDGTLCMWHPRDPVEQRWTFNDGLAMLLAMIENHLFREAWWRETGEWLGPEAPHGDAKAKEGRDAA